jgi:hypothetical protein
MAVSLQDLGGAAQQILDLFVAQLESQGVELPSKQFIAPSPNPPWDGEQVSVAFAGMTQGQPGAAIGGTMIGSALNQMVTFSVSIVRKISELDTSAPLNAGAIPDADAMTADGLLVIGDASALWIAAAEIKATQTLARGNEGFGIGPCLPVGPEGGLAAQRLQIDLSAG